jgi:hypothetical protein
MKKYTFNKELGNWYIDLPNWEGTKAELQMVAGADTLLDHLSNNGTIANVSISIDKKSPEGFQTLKRIFKTPPNGCIYHLGFTPVWLCNVTKFVFEGVFPKQIHFKVEEIELANNTKNSFLYPKEEFGKMKKGVVLDSKTYDNEIIDNDDYNFTIIKPDEKAKEI